MDGVMRGVAGSVVAFVLGCGAAAAPAPAPVERVQAVRGREATVVGLDAPTAPVLLRRIHEAPRRYRRTVTVFMSDVGDGSPFRYTATGIQEVTPRDGVLETVLTFEQSSASVAGDPAELPDAMQGLERVVLAWADDERNRRVREVEVRGEAPDNRAFVAELVESLALVRIEYPEAPAVAGQAWELPEIRWDTRPFGWVDVRVRREIELARVDGDVARMPVRVRVAVEPFHAMGIPLEGEADLTGTLHLDLRDGHAGRLAVDGEAVLHPVGSRSAAVRVVLKLEQEIAAIP